MRNISLYDLLTGYFSMDRVDLTSIDLSYFDKFSEYEKTRHSIVENLTKLLATRQGSVQHLPDYGLPDIMQIYVDSGYSFDPLKKHIRDTILKYEPRLSKVRVEEPKFDKDNFRIYFKIVATIQDFPEAEILLTEFSTTGWTKVVFERESK